MIAERLPVGDDVEIDLAPAIVERVEDLFEDDRPFDLDVVEARRHEDTAEDVRGFADVVRMHGRRERGVVPRGEAVQVAAEILHRRVERGGVFEAVAAPEEHVLEEVREAVGLRGLVPGSDAHVHGNARGMQVRHPDGDQGQAVILPGYGVLVGGQSPEVCQGMPPRGQDRARCCGQRRKT